MAEFKELMKQKDRMCNTLPCDACALNYQRNQHGIPCAQFIVYHPDEAEAFIMEWAKENPVKSNAQKFEEVFGFKPNLTLCPQKCTTYQCSTCDLGWKWWTKEYKGMKQQ